MRWSHLDHEGVASLPDFNRHGDTLTRRRPRTERQFCRVALVVLIARRCFAEVGDGDSLGAIDRGQGPSIREGLPMPNYYLHRFVAFLATALIAAGLAIAVGAAPA